MAHSGKSELDAKHKSPVHQYQQIKFKRSHNTNSASLQKLNLLCDILDLVNCVLWETSVLMLFSTCITEIFVISTKAPESVIQHCNLMAIYYQSRIFSSRLRHKVPLYILEAHLMTNAKSTVH